MTTRVYNGLLNRCLLFKEPRLESISEQRSSVRVDRHVRNNDERRLMVLALLEPEVRRWR